MNESDEEPNTLAIAEPLPQVASENTVAWSKIEASRLNDRMKRALCRVAGGMSYREASEAEGYASHSDVYRYARQFGLSTFTSPRIVEAHRKNALLAAEELGGRLEDAPESFKAGELNFISGTSTDKVAKYENWDGRRSDAPSYASALEKLAETLAKTGTRLEISVAPRPQREESCGSFDPDTATGPMLRHPEDD